MQVTQLALKQIFIATTAKKRHQGYLMMSD